MKRYFDDVFVLDEEDGGFEKEEEEGTGCVSVVVGLIVKISSKRFDACSREFNEYTSFFLSFFRLFLLIFFSRRARFFSSSFFDRVVEERGLMICLHIISRSIVFVI